MPNKRRTVAYLKLERIECPKCHHHGRDVRLRTVHDKSKGKEVMKVRCNNCVGLSW